jgi:hypothetical protein
MNPEVNLFIGRDRATSERTWRPQVGKTCAEYHRTEAKEKYFDVYESHVPGTSTVTQRKKE